MILPTKKHCFANLVSGLALLFLFAAQAAADPVIVDHNCTQIREIPESAVISAKLTLHIAYGHTSHGSQIISGMKDLVAFMNGLNYPTDLYAFNSGGANGALDLRDTPFSGASDLGNPNRTQWASATRTYLQNHPEVNVIIWSWCGQVNGSQQDIQQYLDLMSDLEAEYPQVAFVYMTGHLDGTGVSGNVNRRNQQIRDFCMSNDKILYDFADIESYDPDGRVNYMELMANDNCDYSSSGTTSRDHNWAADWQDTHTQGVDWYTCASAHSKPLNANRKAYAAWWLWARLAGWDGTTENDQDTSDPAVEPDPADETSTDETPTDETPTDETPADETPADETSTDQAPADQASPESDSTDADMVTPGCNPIDPSTPGCGLSDSPTSGCGGSD